MLSSKEHLVLLRPSGNTLVIELLFYPEDVRSKDEIEEQMDGVKTTKAELEMASQLVESLSGPFEPEQYENEHKRDLMALIEKKLAGEEITVAPEPEKREPVPDLMAALQASLAQAKDDKRKGAPKPAAKKKKAPAKKTKSRARAKAKA